MTMTQILAALLMLAVAVGLLVAFRKYLAVNSERRLRGMLESVGLDPEIADIGGIETIMSEVRQRCSTCNAESVCEHWLASDEQADNAFCPNARVFEVFKKYRGETAHT